MSAFWHPFADMHVVQHSPFVVDHAEGVYVYDQHGNRYLDATASLWYSNIGHGRTEVVDRVREQLETLPAFHCFIDYATAPPIELAERIAAVSPDPGSKVFFGSSGSDAVDTAAKLARRYFNAIGQPERTVFISREWGYHGTNTYGTSLGGMEPNRIGYGDLVGDVVIVPHDDPEAVEKAIDHAGAERIAGMFVEAVVGGGGVRPVPTSYLTRVRDAIRNAGGLYVADEVITGFGRIGDWFASNRFQLEPDLMTFAKGVTCGYMPLGGVVASPRVAAPFFDEGQTVFRHGYTYSGHAASCVAGLAVMDIIEREGILERAMELESELTAALDPLRDVEVVTDIRSGVGALAAIQLDTSDEGLAARAATACRDAGVLTRAVGGGGLQVSPPLVTSPSEVTEMAERFATGLKTL